MSIRCRLQCTKLALNEYGTGTVEFETRYDAKLCEEQAAFQQATPWGKVEFQIDNPRATAQLQEGKDYYLDVSPVE